MAEMNYHLQFKSLIFDCDGTLLDTMPTHFTAWSEVLERHGIQLTLDRFYSLGGVPVRNIIEMLAGEQGVVVDAVAVAEEKEELFLEILGENLRPVEKVASIAREAERKLPMAVATGSPSWLAERMLKAIGLDHLFGAIIGADKVTHHKPHPETYLVAAASIGADPATCCAFEDTDLGIESARAAGMTVVDIRQI